MQAYTGAEGEVAPSRVPSNNLIDNACGGGSGGGPGLGNAGGSKGKGARQRRKGYNVQKPDSRWADETASVGDGSDDVCGVGSGCGPGQKSAAAAGVERSEPVLAIERMSSIDWLGLVSGSTAERFVILEAWAGGYNMTIPEDMKVQLSAKEVSFPQAIELLLQ